MKTRKQWCAWAVIASAVAFTLAPFAAKAQDAQVAPDSQAAQEAQKDAQNPDQDPPGRVARINFMEGSVTFQPGGENDWVDADLNRPLVTGDNLWADENSRAEVHIGSTALRLGSKTGITLLEVSDRAAQIRLVQGSLIVKVRHVDDEDSYEIDTPNVAFVVMQPGDYRINVDAEGNRTDVTVWQGRAEVTGGGSSYTVVAGQDATFTGADQLNYDIGQTPNSDGFDSWAQNRDQVEEGSESANYVSRDVTGYEDLDQYGDWSYVADYGMCWRPRALAGGWAPYRFGHWAWVGPWGWTWVGDEPWAFAPFHYGRWAYAGTGWMWVPGPAAARPVYAPALVAWVGGKPGSNFSFSSGAGVGWVPLAPGEVFVPGYRVSRAYVNRVNVTNTAVNVARIANVYDTVAINRTTTVNNIVYANRNVNGAVTVVSGDTFANARPVARNVIPVSPKELASAPVSYNVAMEPTHTSAMGAGKPAANRPPISMTSRPVVALRTPTPMPGSTVSSFNQQPTQTNRNSNQSSASPLVKQQAPGRPVATNPALRTSPSHDGFRSFGEPNGEPNTVNDRSKSQPRVWEAQGTPEPEPSTQSRPGNRAAQPSGRSNQSQQTGQSTHQSSHPPVKAATPVQQGNTQQKEEEPKYSSWHQQKSSSPSAQPKATSPPVPKLK